MQSQEPIYGLDKSLDECDEIYWHLDAKVRKDDTYLFTLKWFDYRFMHSVHATYLFADAYRTAYREAFKVNFDHERGEYVSGLKGQDIFDFTKKRTNDMTGFVRARQYADMMGMPYIEYTRIAVDWAMRRTRKFLPRPCHLYNFSLLTAIQETWRDRKAGKIYVATDPLFKNEAYQSLQHQDAHHEWLLQQAALRANADHYLARMLYDEDVLLESKVAARFGAETIDRCRSLQ